MVASSRRRPTGRFGTAAVFALLSLSVAGAARSDPSSPPETALADYVGEADSSYMWQQRARYDAAGAEVVELRLHSQTWQDVLWKHQLYVIRPDNVDADSRQGLLIIGGGRWRDSYDAPPTAAELPDDAGLYIAIAQQLGSITAVLTHVPFQPIFGLREDELIAHTFERYLVTGDAEWPLLLPMVKSAVRGMDATQAFTADEWGIDLERFTVAGGSKRGWTTWLTGAVDPRAAALAPIVIDAVRFDAHMPHQTRMWGEPSDELRPYTRRGLHDVLGSETGRDLRRIVDPYSYFDRLTQPKLVVVATNDRYFPIDSLNLYWGALRSPKHVLYLPNDGHGIEDLGRFVPALRALHRRTANGGAPAGLDWEFAPSPRGLRLCIRSEIPTGTVVAWSATSDDTDFRDETFVGESIVEPGDDAAETSPGRSDSGNRSPRGRIPSGSSPGSAASTLHTIVFDAPESGYKAVFAEALISDGIERYLLSTNVRIIDAQGRAPLQEAVVSGTPGVCPDQ